MAMNYGDKIVTSIYGRRLGLQVSSSGQFGTSKRLDLLVGPDALRAQHSTSETTSTNLSPAGVSVLANSSAGSSQVWTIDPPIPGVEKTLVFGTTVNTQYLKGANGETFQSSQGTSMTVLKSTQLVLATLKLTPLSTAAWLVGTGLSTASILGATTT